MRNLVYALAVLLMLAACSRRPEQEVEAAPSQEVAEQPSPGQRPRQRVQLERVDSATPQAAPSPVETKAMSLLPLQPTERLLPEDFEIGPLQDMNASDSDSREVIGLLHAFLTSLAREKTRADLLAPEHRTEVTRSLTFHKERGNTFDRFRIGKISMQAGSSASVRVRLFGNPGTTAGDIHLLKIAGKWRISDLQIAFQELQTAYDKPQTPFLPNISRWIIRER